MTRQVTYNICLFLLCLCLPAVLVIRAHYGVSAGHMDEYDYLFVGKTLLAGDHWPTHTYIFGWDLNWLLLAWGDSVFGGLNGARLVSAVIGLISLAGMYLFVYSLWRNHLAALVAAILLGFECAHLYTSALATYDIISFTLFICALPCAMSACQPSRLQLVWTFASCTLLSMAILSKYTTFIYLPFVAALVLWKSPRSAFIGGMLITTIVISYVTLNYEQLKTLYEIQIQRTHGANTTLLDILNRSGRQLWASLVLAAIAIIHAAITRHEARNSLLLLTALSMPFFVYHLVTQNVISLQKHLIFSSLFLIPIIAWGLQQYHENSKQSFLNVAVVLTCIAAYSLVNLNNLWIMQSSYPDVRNINAISSQIHPSDSVLSEDPYLFRYLLYDKVAQGQISETSWLDNNKDGKYERRDVRQAVWDRKFDYVFLNDQQHRSFNTLLRKMLQQRDYVLIVDNHYKLNTMSGNPRYGVISLYRNNKTNAQHQAKKSESSTKQLAGDQHITQACQSDVTLLQQCRFRACRRYTMNNKCHST